MVVFAIFLVVLVTKGKNVVEGEAIVARKEIDALLGFALPLTINSWAAEQMVGHSRHGIIYKPFEWAFTHHDLLKLLARVAAKEEVEKPKA